jgi:CheY-like chemotaxis protein
MSVVNSVSEWQVVSANVQLNGVNNDASKLKWLTDCLDTAQPHHKMLESLPVPPQETPVESSPADRFEVLILDDSPFEGEAVALLCKAHSYEVTVVEREEDALSLLKSVDGDRIDFVLVDFHQPKPFDCFKFINKVAELRPQKPVAVVSADEKPGFLLNCIYIRSLAGFFLKPLTYQHVGLFRSIVSQRVAHNTRQQAEPKNGSGSGGEKFEHSGTRSGFRPEAEVATVMHGLPVLEKVLHEQFSVLSFQARESDANYMMEIFLSVGWGINYKCHSARNVAELQGFMRNEKIDILLLDAALPRQAFVQSLRASCAAGLPCLSKY